MLYGIVRYVESYKPCPRRIMDFITIEMRRAIRCENRHDKEQEKGHSSLVEPTGSRLCPASEMSAFGKKSVGTLLRGTLQTIEYHNALNPQPDSATRETPRMRFL